MDDEASRKTERDPQDLAQPLATRKSCGDFRS